MVFGFLRRRQNDASQVPAEAVPAGPPSYAIGGVTVTVTEVNRDHVIISASGPNEADNLSALKTIHRVLAQGFINHGQIAPDQKLHIIWSGNLTVGEGDSRGLTPSFKDVCEDCQFLSGMLKTPEELRGYAAEKFSSTEPPTRDIAAPAYIQKELSPLCDAVIECMHEQGIAIPEERITLPKDYHDNELAYIAHYQHMEIPNDPNFREVLEIYTQLLKKKQSAGFATAEPYAFASHAAQLALSEFNIECTQEFLDGLKKKLTALDGPRRE
jgi:hypothetical protein